MLIPTSVKRKTENNFFTVLLWGLTEKLVWSHLLKYKGSKQKEERVLYNPIYTNLRKAKQKHSDGNQNSDYDRLGYWLGRNIQEHSRLTNTLYMYAGSGKAVIGNIKSHNNVHTGKEYSCRCRGYKRCGFNPWVGKIPGGGNGNPLQYSCWRIPWTEKPGGLQSREAQRLGQFWVTEYTHTHTPLNKKIEERQLCAWAWPQGQSGLASYLFFCVQVWPLHSLFSICFWTNYILATICAFLQLKRNVRVSLL